MLSLCTLAAPCATTAFAAGIAHHHYRILSNAPFDAKATGMVGALEVKVPREDSPQARKATLDQAIAQERVRVAPAQRRAKEILRRLDRLPKDGRLRFCRRAVWTRDGKTILPEREHNLRTGQRFGGGTLQFAYAGWSASDQQIISDYLSRAYPVMVSVYGQPASNITVTIRQDENLYETVEGGIYDATNNEIRVLPLLNPQSPGADMFGIAHLVLHAFHDDLMFSYDAWEEGFARAAALLVQTRLDPTFEPGNPDATGGSDGFYVLPNYDFMNQPALGNAILFPQTVIPFSMVDILGAWRIGMAQASWVKVAAENLNYFRDFNSSYYAQYQPDLEGNVPALKQIARSSAPTVEGLSFTDWYRRQYILDTSITVGLKLYVAPFPFSDYMYINLHHYTTTTTGDEVPQGGVAQLTYRNYLSDDLFAEEGNEAPIPSSGVDAGLGSIAPSFFNIGGACRVSVDIVLNGLSTTIIYPYNVSGPSGNDLFGPLNPCFGSVVGSEDGTITLSGAWNDSSPMTNGVFTFLDLPRLTFPTKVTVDYVAEDTGQHVVLQKNVAWEYAALVFTSPISVTTLTHTFPKGTTGYQLIALPGRPLISDEAAVFGVSPDRFLMARWRPELAGEDKYQLYPNITSPLGPGVGAWVKLEKDANVSVQAEPIATDSDYRFKLMTGFNQIGTPTDATFDLAKLFVQVPGGAIQEFGTAQAAGLISGGVFEYSQTDGYKLVTALSGWKGYWMRATSATGLDLVFPTAGSRQSSVTRNSPLATHQSPLPGPIGLDPNQMRADNWSFRISATTSVIKDLDNFIGVTPGATDGLDNACDIVQPPEFGGYVSLYFPATSGQGQMPLAADIRSPFGGKKDWDFVVTTNLGDIETTLSWDAGIKLPKRLRSLRVTLTDLDTGVVRNMRTMTYYTFRSGNSGLRHFRISVDTRPSPPVTLGNLAVSRLPRGVLVSFKASQPVRAIAEIYSIRNRKLTTLEAKPTSIYGDYSFRWEGRDERGRPTPSGVYLIRFSLSDEEHRSYRYLRVIRVE